MLDDTMVFRQCPHCGKASVASFEEETDDGAACPHCREPLLRPARDDDKIASETGLDDAPRPRRHRDDDADFRPDELERLGLDAKQAKFIADELRSLGGRVSKGLLLSGWLAVAGLVACLAGLGRELWRGGERHEIILILGLGALICAMIRGVAGYAADRLVTRICDALAWMLELIAYHQFRRRRR